jgi:hypothetical protein
MNPDLLTLRRFTAGVLYPPLGFQPVDINRIYTAITERYPYQSLQHLPDGARMANPDGDCFIQQTRMQVNESVTHFQLTKEKCVDIFEIIQEHLKVPQFITVGVKLVAFVPTKEAPMAAQFMEDRVLSSFAEKLDVLGEGRQGVGVRVLLHKDGIHDVRIEPFFSDLSQLYVELDVQHPKPFNDLAIVEDKIQAAYDYMFGPIKLLLAQF